MEVEQQLEPRVKPLSFKVKATSRESSSSQKASHVLDPDLRSHWSTGTNTKEWILLELDEPCLLSHIRIYNKSVLEWEIAVGLRYKPETFVRVRPRCEAPRREMLYPMSYTACRYVRISCLRGNPIAIFFIQLIGVSVIGLEAEFQPVVNYLLPHILSHKQDTYDLHLQLLQDITNRLFVFLTQLEADLTNFLDDAESNIRFLAMLSGPFYPILHLLIERFSGGISDLDASKALQPSSALTVSSNFEPRKSRSTSLSVVPTSSSAAFRPDAVILLLRKAYRDPNLKNICRLACRILQKLITPLMVEETSVLSNDVMSSDLEKTLQSETAGNFFLSDYSDLFGEEFRISGLDCDMRHLNLLDIGAVEEGILHILYASAAQPSICRMLADDSFDLWSALPLVQALLPALRPCVSGSDHIDEEFSQWKQPFVHKALSQIVATSSSSLYRPLLRACAGYLSSFSPSHAKAACILIDLCSSLLAPWTPLVIGKVDLALELTEDFLGVIQNARHSSAHPRARAALKYILLALYGHMDDVLAKYKEVKHETLFLLEMLEPFLDPAIIASQNTIAFGDLSTVYSEKQENDCAFALNLIRTAVLKPGVLASLESEWRCETVSPSVLLKVLDPHATFPAEIDFRKPPTKVLEPESSSAHFSSFPGGMVPTKPYSLEDSEGKEDVPDAGLKMDASEDVSLFFAPPEFRTLVLSDTGSTPESSFNCVSTENIMEDKSSLGKNLTCQINKVLRLCNGSPIDFLNLHADYLQLHNYPECELRASEFRRLASDLNSQSIITPECHDASIDALLLAAECYVNPLFMSSFTTSSQKVTENFKILQKCEIAEVRRVFSEINNLEKLAHIEWKRDKIVLRILLEAAKLDRSYEEKLGGGHLAYYGECYDEDIINLSMLDGETADAVTLVRQNQALLCKFLVKQLQNGQHPLHEILMQSLIFLLQSATKLFCTPEDVIDVILRSAEYLNVMLTLLYYQFKEGNRLVDTGKAHEVHRCWVLLQKLVFVSSGANQEPGKVNFSGISLFGNLIPPSAWINRIPAFSSSAYPLVRFLGWMAVSRIAKNYMNEQVFLSSGLSQLTYLLSIYADELALASNSAYGKNHDLKNGVEKDIRLRDDQSFCAVYPDLSYFFPEMKQQFEAFGVAILESVGLQLRSFPSSSVPDILCWFSDLCTWPFLLKERNSTRDSTNYMKGYVVKNAKAIILFILEAIVIEHMESIVPEVPRVVQVLVSICRSSFCDVSFLESILSLLKPIISYSLSKVPYEEKLLTDDTCINFESLCFAELFNNIRHKKEDQGSPADEAYSRALTIFILASLFLDFSFQRKRDFLQSLCSWADFSSSEPTTTFHDYFSAFLLVLDSSKVLLLERLRVIGAIPLQLSHSEVSRVGVPGNKSQSSSCFLNDIFRDDVSSGLETGNVDEVMNGSISSLSNEDVDNMCKDLEGLISKLYQTIDPAWKLHPLLAKKLTVASAECFVYGRCLSSISSKSDSAAVHDAENACISDKFDQLSVHWKLSLQGLAETILILQEKHCWEVAYLMLDCLLGVPKSFSLDNVVTIICFAIKNFSCSAPQISWRLQTRKWLSVLFARGIHIFTGSEISLAELFQTMLGHPEPEQRCIALQCLTNLLGDDGRPALSLSNLGCECPLDTYMSEHRKILSYLISNAWNQVSSLAAADSSLIIRTRAMALLIDSVPFVERPKLQSFLSAADSVLHGLGKLALSTCEGPLFQLSLALIANACLYSPSVDIALIPEHVWADIETLGESRTGKIGDLEKKTCQTLHKLRNEGDGYKEVLKEVLSSSFSKQFNPEFEATRESIIQVIAGLTSIRSYFDVFVEEIDEETKELEEAEIELEMVQKDKSVQDSSEHFKERHHPLLPTSSTKGGSRLKQIKETIHALEKSEIREAISARRQMKLLARRSRQKYLEEAALREAELLQNLDRERTTEAEKEIERERLLELERAKTRELRHSLEMEKERQTQRDLQRELEQVESGLRTSRREFSSSTHASRPRDRYRERDGRSGIEGNVRTSSGNLEPETSTSMGTTPAIVSSGSRTFPVQPTILQARDRQDDCGSNYEENFEGSKDSGDAGSVGDPETFDSLSDRYGSAQRPSRGSKTKQGMERRERDGRRGSKWERKH